MRLVWERVKLFQQVNGLAETGVVDEQTLTLLYSDTAIANQTKDGLVSGP